ncbi:MAG TPA: CPBP family intramembrane metalloprotease [Acholeplasmataceae bacterium]|nr:CPBP family intramembrane metalloprotease [Acholeplasmataceae bacterium]
MKQVVLKISIVFAVAIGLLGLPLVAGYIANEIPAASLDPNGVFWWISVHHIAQAILFVPFFFLVKYLAKETNFKLGLGDVKKGRRYVIRFTLFFIIYTIIGFGIALMTKTLNTYSFPINTRNVLGYLGFQLFLSGPSEELIFRAFGITVIALVLPKRLLKGKLSVANLIIATIFGLAHVGIFFSPFRLSYSLTQVGYAFVLGLIYGDCYEKTESVLYPMMIHSISNVIAVATTMIFTVLL